MSGKSKEARVAELIELYRIAANRDVAFDRTAAERLGVSATDLHCLNIIESRRGLTAGELATESGLTTGAVTAVIDRLERAGLARRAADERDRRKVIVEVTAEFYERAGEIWGPVAADWQRSMSRRFSAEELSVIAEFLEQAGGLAARHAERISRVED